LGPFEPGNPIKASADGAIAAEQAMSVDGQRYREVSKSDIGAANRRRGFSSSGVRAMYRDWMNQRRLMAIYPLND
jgi:hypothetical protein